jgi:lipase chaperone LimK
MRHAKYGTGYGVTSTLVDSVIGPSWDPNRAVLAAPEI